MSGRFWLGGATTRFLFLLMACLEAAFAEKKELTNLKKSEGAQKVRLVANPLVIVSQLEDVLHSFMKHRQTGDLLSLVCPPPLRGHRTLGGTPLLQGHGSPRP